MNKITFEYVSGHDEFFGNEQGEDIYIFILDQIKILIDGKYLLLDFFHKISIFIMSNYK
jgi:hypothetical protein